jgi:Protein of unknown function (DUF3105)
VLTGDIGYILRVRAVLFAVVAAFPLAPLAAGACGGSSGSSSGPAFDAALYDQIRLDEPIRVDAPCTVLIDAPPYLPALHVPVGTHVDYDSNPPSSGPHYPIWAAYQEWPAPVQREYYVHDLEHGAVVLLYKCPDGGPCPEIVDALRKARDAIPDDPLCGGTGVRVRVVITPDPLLDVPIAAAAWGWIYKAQCVDLPSLTQFARDHYGQGTEPICTNGTTTL